MGSGHPFNTALTRIMACGALSIALTTLACGTSSPPTTPSGGVPAGPSSAVAGCEITTSSPGTPLLSDPKSPYFDYLGVASSADGRSASNYREALAHASAPDGTRLPDGTIGVYYNSGETGGIWFARLTGTTLTPVSAITVNGVLRPQWMADVNVDLVGGKVRMVYLNGEGVGRKFCIAESADGVTFQTLALAIQFSGTEADPTVVRLADGTWLMAFSRANHTQIGLARSGDGLTFAQFATADYGVVPELAATGDGRVRLYTCQAGGVNSRVSGDGGTTWTLEGQVIAPGAVGRAIVCDPSYLSSDGVFVLKTTDAM